MSDLAKRAQALMEAIETDEAFKSALVEAMQAGDPEKAVKLAAEKGIVFTVDELAPAEAEGRKLDDAEFEAVAGGGIWGEVGKATPCVVMAVRFAVA